MTKTCNHIFYDKVGDEIDIELFRSCKKQFLDTILHVYLVVLV